MMRARRNPHSGRTAHVDDFELLTRRLELTFQRVEVFPGFVGRRTRVFEPLDQRLHVRDAGGEQLFLGGWHRAGRVAPFVE
jgi:hypothetical protein